MVTVRAGTPNNDKLHHHTTPEMVGELEVVFAKATPGYLRSDRVETNLRLTRLLAEGKTDPRYARPETFQRIVLGVGGTILFRLNEPDGTPLLHGFNTLGGGRISILTPVYRVEPDAPPLDTREEMLSAIMYDVPSGR